MWIAKLTNNCTVLLNLTLGPSPIILHTNMKILESGQVFTQILGHLIIPFYFLYCCTYRLIVYGWNATISKPSDSVVNFSVYCPSLDVKITSSLSQQVLAHTKATHRQHLFSKNGIALKINVPIIHQPSEKISF